MRQPLPERVSAIAASIRDVGQLTPIEVVDTEQGFELLSGALRLEAVKLLGGTEIEANVQSAEAFKSRHQLRIRQIRENLERFALNALERSVAIATWKESFEALHGAPKRGRRKAAETSEDEMSAKFALNFSDEVQKAFGLSRRSVFLALKIASINADVRSDIAYYPIAENQSELLALAELGPQDQRAVCDLIVDEASGATTVSDALAIARNLPKPRQPAAWEKTSQHFSKLTQKDQNRFFELHTEAIEKWLVSRRR